MRWDGAPEGSMSLPPGDDDFWGPVPIAETESFLTISEMTGRDFPAGPVVRTHRFHCQGLYSVPSWRTKILQVTQC